MNNLVEAVFKEEITQKGLADLKLKYPEDLKVDMSDDLEFKAARKTRTEKNKLVEAINRRRIDITTELKSYSDGIIDTIGDIYDVVTAPFEVEDQRRKDEAKKAEEEREAKLNEERTHIRAIEDFYSSASGKSSDEISGIIEAVDMIEVDGFDKELIHEAIEVKKVTLEKLDALLSDTKNREILAEEREKLAEESAAAAKKAAIVERLNTLKMIPTTMFGKTSEEIGNKINSLNNFSVTTEEFGDLAEESNDAMMTVISQLEAMESQQLMVEDAAVVKQEQAEEAGRIAKEAAESRENELKGDGVADDIQLDDEGHIASGHNPDNPQPDNIPCEAEDDLPFVDPDCSVQETGTSDMTLMEAVNEWASGWNIELPAIQELSAILKERGLI